VKKDVVAATPAPTPVEPAPVAATSPAAKAPGDEPAPTPVEPEAPAPVETKTDDGAPSLDDLVAQTIILFQVADFDKSGHIVKL